MRAKVAAITCLLLVISGCARPVPGEPDCISGAKTIEQLRELKPFTNFQRLGGITVQGGTTSVTASDDLHVERGPSDEWIVTGHNPDEVFITIKQASSEQAKRLEAGYRFSILANRGSLEVYLQKATCFSILEPLDAIAYRENVSLIVYST